MLTIAAPSRTIMSTSGTKLFASSVNGRRSSRHRSMSDVVASLNFPLSDIEGGDDWFSCWKISISHLTRDVYSWKQMPVPFHGQQLFRVWIFALSGRNLNKGTLFLGILSVTGVVCCTSRQLKNPLHWRSPSSFKLLTESMTPAFLTSCLSRTKRSLLVSVNGLPIFCMVSTKTFTFLRKDACVAKTNDKKIIVIIAVLRLRIINNRQWYQRLWVLKRVGKKLHKPKISLVTWLVLVVMKLWYCFLLV